MASADRIVCRCNLVTENDLIAFLTAFPDMNKEYVLQYLNIGVRCGCCRSVECPNIDIHYSQVIKNVSV